MKLSAVKEALSQLDQLVFELPDGTLVPRHFHVTEIGKISKQFIDCGGTVRNEERVQFQLWNANDYDHRLHPEKLVNIIELSEKTLDLQDHEVEVEYQGQTIEKFALEFNGRHFRLTTTHTDCLAKDNCGIPQESAAVNACAPGSGCC